jgi:hypothetical protein
MNTIRCMILSAAAVALGLAGASSAARAGGADAYEKSYEAIAVKTLCEDSGAPDKATMEKLAAYIAGQAQFAITAGESLTAIEKAKDAAAALVKSAGCEDRAVGQLISLYHATVAAAQ